MMLTLLSMAVQAAPPVIAIQPQPMVVARGATQPGDTVTSNARIARSQPITEAERARTDRLMIRLVSPQGVLWQGVVHVNGRRAASFNQNLSDSTPVACPQDSGYDQSTRQSLSFNVYAQDNERTGRQYRVDGSWTRAVNSSACVGAGTRTVQASSTVALEDDVVRTIDADAGFRIEIRRAD